jgi:AcrR family transcriptional regulator
MNKPSGRGRRSGSPDTAAVIRSAAKERFLADGYQGTTMRSIAQDAGVDVALVSYYFGSKQALFGAAMALPVNPIEVVVPLIAGDLDGLADRLLASLLSVWDDPSTGPALQALARAAAVEPDLQRVIREAVGGEIVGHLSRRLGGPDATERAGMFAAQMAGVIFARYVLQLEPIASMSAEQVVEYLGPSVALALGTGPPARRRRRT